MITKENLEEKRENDFAETKWGLPSNKRQVFAKAIIDGFLFLKPREYLVKNAYRNYCQEDLIPCVMIVLNKNKSRFYVELFNLSYLYHFEIPKDFINFVKNNFTVPKDSFGVSQVNIAGISENEADVILAEFKKYLPSLSI